MKVTYRILHIDDREDVLDATARRLESYVDSLGTPIFQVSRARSGVEALEEFRRVSPHAVLLDFDFTRTSRETGTDILRMLRVEDVHVPVVISSAVLVDPDDEKALIHAGASFVFRKATSDPVLVDEVLRRLLDEHSEFIATMESWAAVSPAADRPIFRRSDGMTITMQEGIQEMRRGTALGRKLLHVFRLGMLSFMAEQQPPLEAA